MAESVTYLDKTASKEEKYTNLIPQIKALSEGEPNLIAKLANITAMLYHGLDCYWVGFYLVENDQLVLGPFQGPVACTRIPFGKGVCGSAWELEETITVRNVAEFPGHIACSIYSISEIVVPVFDQEESVAMVLDIDSDKEAYFDEVDEKYLKEISRLIQTWL